MNSILFRCWSHWSRSVRWRSLALLMALGLMAAQAQAAQILVLFTKESAGDGIKIVNNCKQEFKTWADQNGSTVTYLTNSDNTPRYLNDAQALTPTDLVPATGVYDVIVTCTVYEQSTAGTRSVINQAIKNRTARAFLLFDEAASFREGWIHAIPGWAVAPGNSGYTIGIPQVVNPQSKWNSSFASGLAVMGGHSYAAFDGVPVDNALYTPQPLAIPPAPPKLSIVNGVSTLVVPLADSYPDQNGVGQGACVFASTDVSMFDEVRYPFATGNSPANIGRIAPAFMSSLQPGGACSPLPSVTKTFSPATTAPGGTSVLTITVKNNGGYTDSQGVVHAPAAISGLNLTDNLPAPLILAGAPTSTCGGTPVGTPNGNAVGVQNGTLPSDLCTITAQVTWPSNSAGMAACTDAQQRVANNLIAYGPNFGSSIGPAYGTAPAGGSSPFDAKAKLTCTANPMPVISVEKTSNVANVMPSGSVIFTVKVSNSGTVDATGVSVSDPMSTDWSSSSWSCASSTGTSCGTGSGGVNATGLTVPAQGALTYTITSTPSGTVASAVNVATVTPGNGLCADGSSSCRASARVNVQGTVKITKVLSSQSATPAVPGATLTYSITVTNSSTSIPVSGAIAVTDPLPPGVSSGTWTCAKECGGLTSGQLPLNVSLPGLLPYNQDVNPWHLTPTGEAVFTVTATIDPNNRQYSSIVNSATATPTAPDMCVDGNPSCTANAAAVPVVLPAAVLITKTLTSPAVVSPGSTATYEITVSNPSATKNVANPVVVAEVLPTGVGSGTLSCTSGCAASVSTGPLSATISSIAAGGVVKYSASFQIPTTAAHGAMYINTATATPSGADVCAVGTSPCTASAPAVTVQVPGKVQVSKTLTSAATAKPGDVVSYQIVVNNPSTGPVTQPVTVADTLPAGLDAGTWTCAGACGSATSGSTPLNAQLPSLAAGATATYTVSTKVSATAANDMSIVNRATVTPSAPETCADGQTSCSSDAPPVKVQVVVKPVDAQPVPSMSAWGLMAMSVLLMVFGVAAQRRRMR